jgi:signal transduction histidine kinase
MRTNIQQVVRSLTTISRTLLVITFLSGFAGLGVASVAWRRQKARGARPFAVYSLCISGWVFSAGLLWLGPGPRLVGLLDVATRMAGTVVAVAWVYFVVAYTKQRKQFVGWRQRIVLGFFAVDSLLALVLFVDRLTGEPPAATEYHGLTVVTTRTVLEPRPYGLVPLLVGLGILFWTFYVLWRYYQSEVTGQRQQARLVLFAGVAPTVAFFGYNAGNLTLHEHMDPTPLFFTITVAGTAYALFVSDFLDLEPVAANALFETMADPVFILGDGNTVVNANEAAIEIGASVDEPLPRQLQTAVDQSRSEVTVDAADGDRRVFDLSVTPVGDGSRRLVVLRDITLRTGREQELERQNERLDEFASVVSHDLRNPLTVAHGYLDRVEETGDLTQAEKVRKSLTRIEEIIEDLLAMSKAGKDIESTEPVQLAAVARDAWEQVPAGDDVGFETDTELTIEADRSRLGRLFENLFRNAIEHNETPLSITVETIGEGSPVGFAVSDNGSGVPPAKREKILEHGYTTNEDGTGLGLSIVRDIADAHGWEVAVTESDTGGGRFEIRTGGQASGNAVRSGSRPAV